MFQQFVFRSRRAAVSLAVATVALSGVMVGNSSPASAAEPRDAAVEWAKSQIGKPYAYGGNGPSSFDCSGLVQQAWKSAGVELPRVANSQFTTGQRVPLSEVRTGDIVAWGSNTSDPSSVYHVGLYANDNIVVVAPNRGGSVKLDQLDSTAYGLFPYAMRPVA